VSTGEKARENVDWFEDLPDIESEEDSNASAESPRDQHWLEVFFKDPFRDTMAQGCNSF